MEMSELRIPPDAMVLVGASAMQHGTLHRTPDWFTLQISF
jgi:hypothetical protein